jgi:LmbE family N-acetylglucosaminyl deacetylase
MKLSFAGERLLAVMAHPDDAELLCAGTLARARADGATVGIYVLCDGSKGVASADDAPSDLGALRRSEANDAAKLLGADLLWHGAADGELHDNDDQRLRVIETYRNFRPTLVLAHAPEDYHPDHRAAGALAEAASWFAASRGFRTGSLALDAPPALWWCDTINMCGFEPALYVDISAHAELKQRMLACHPSQLARGGDRDFAPLAELMRRQYETRGAQADVAAAEVFRPHHAFKRIRAV